MRKCKEICRPKEQQMNNTVQSNHCNIVLILWCYLTFCIVFSANALSLNTITASTTHSLFRLRRPLIMSDFVREQTQEEGLKFYHSLRNCKDNFISSHLNSALDALRDTLRLYGPENVFSSYNGGKDADVIMHLLRAVCAKYQEDYKIPCVPKLVYFGIEDEFDEVLDHLNQTEKFFNVNLLRYDCGIVEVGNFLIFSILCFIYRNLLLGC